MQLQYCPPPQVRRFWSWLRTEGTPEHVPISNQSNLTCRNWRKNPWYAATILLPGEEVLELAKDRRDSWTCIPISYQSNLTCRNWRKYPWYAASCPPPQVRRFWSWPRTEGTPEHVPISNQSILTCTLLSVSWELVLNKYLALAPL
jgi:hypothetical protein